MRFNYGAVNGAALSNGNPNVIAALLRDPSVLSVIPDRTVRAIQQGHGNEVNGKGAPGGGGSAVQIVPKGVQRVGLPTPASNGASIGVAILDTGIDLSNADLSPSSLTFSAFGASCQDDDGHGTHVAGIVAALDNSVGVLGVAPAATPYCVKVLDAQGNGSDSDVIAGLEFVLANAATATPPIRVVNMSLGREGSVNDNPALRAAVTNLYNAGITVVTAAGNDATKEVKNMVPASYPEAVAVASTSAADGTNACRQFSGVIRADTASFFTTDGAYQVDTTSGLLMGVTISAPGEDQENISRSCFISSVGILSTKLGGGTTRMFGTSMASPHVAGVVARMIQNNILGPESIRSALRSTAIRVGTAPANSPTTTYSFDTERGGIVKAP
jgi:subtilisin family serine protease